MTDSAPTTGLSFSDVAVAQRARDAIRQIAGNVVDVKGSNPNVGRVMSVDIARLTASVWFPGDDGPVQVGLFPGSIPLDLGDYRGTSTYNTSAVGTGGLVYVENFRGSPYITRILSGGEYELNANVAGVTHRMFNANYQGTISGPPVTSDIFQREINVLVNSGSGFVQGNSLLVGPWSGTNDGSTVDGIIELTIAYLVSGNVKNQVRKYQFSISDRMVVDLQSGNANKPFWMRLIPETNLATNPPAELAIDVSLIRSNIRTSLEFWFRLVPMDTLADQSSYFMSVKTYGSAFNVGDPRTGRLVLIKETVAAPLQGFVGFHNSGMGFTERDEQASFPQGSYYQGDEWTSGSWRSGALRAANDLRWTWAPTGQWFFGTDNRLLWEGNIVFKGIGPNWNALHNGNITVPFPSLVEVYPSDPATFTTQYRSAAGGILLNAGDTLYYGLQPGSGSGGQGAWMNPSDTFFIVDSKTYNASQHNWSLPEWAIPIATRALTNLGERREIIILNKAAEDALDDKTRYIELAYNAPHNGIVGLDETETMDVPSFRYKKKTAYRVTFRVGFSSATTPQAIQFRLKKGTTAAGAQILEFFRAVLHGTTGPIYFNSVSYFCNDTTADIVTPMVITGTSNGAATTTWNRYGNANDQAVIRIEECGPSSAYAFNWKNLT